MKEIIHRIFTKHHIWITFSLTCLVALIIGFGEYRLYELRQQVGLQAEKIASTTTGIQGQLTALDAKVKSIVEQNNLLNNTVQEQISQSSALADQVEQVSDTAEALDKLSKVDPQLLQKYSKVYFLNEHYTPANLVTIPNEYSYGNDKKFQLEERIDYYLEKMFKKALADDIDLRVISAYRSFNTQATLKSGYQVVYGAGTANQFSADQGYSEHQLGTTVDLTTPDTKENFDIFDKTTAYTWLEKNAYKYGFVLSYPKGNSYYTYEPWHWRFVGVDLATRLHRDGELFYDLDQRVINNYLGVFFD
jgi:D-alanyl-D-alanine carboxypeptidase